MNSRISLIPIGWLLLSAACFALGEYLSKKWAMNPSTFGAAQVVAAYAIGTLAWLPALLCKNELAVMGTLWLLLATVGTVVVGIFIFHESVTVRQGLGIGLSAVAMILLSF